MTADMREAVRQRSDWRWARDLEDGGRQVLRTGSTYGDTGAKLVLAEKGYSRCEAPWGDLHGTMPSCK